MNQERTQADIHTNPPVARPTKFLSPAQVEMIDEALAALGEFGEVRLVVEKGRLRFVVTQNSHDALKWQPGTLGRKG
jgi:16S rRNA G1207 methylase RsmC